MFPWYYIMTRFFVKEIAFYSSLYSCDIFLCFIAWYVWYFCDHYDGFVIIVPSDEVCGLGDGFSLLLGVSFTNKEVTELCWLASSPTPRIIHRLQISEFGISHRLSRKIMNAIHSDLLNVEFYLTINILCATQITALETCLLAFVQCCWSFLMSGKHDASYRRTPRWQKSFCV